MVVKDNDEDRFSQTVNNKLAAGWELKGRLIARGGGGSSVKFIQAMVLRREEVPFRDTTRNYVVSGVPNEDGK